MDEVNDSFSAFLKQLKHRTNIVTLIGRHVSLTKKGTNYWGLCPFHKEKTPSFSVKEDEGYYHCFGCGASGDAIGFLQEKEGLDFMAAVRQLAHDAGMTVPADRKKAPSPQYKELSRLMQDAAAWYRAQLTQPDASHAQEWITQRQLSDDTQKLFQLGYAPKDGKRLLAHLKGKGFSDDLIAKAGITAIGDNDSTPYHRYRNRIIFPIHDAHGDIIAFGGRDLGNAPAKYINSPSTVLFNKKQILYGLHHALPAIKKERAVIVTEGYMDSIALWQAGIHHTVATLGTSINKDHILTLWRWCDCPLLCFDGDTAGASAAARAIMQALPFVSARKQLALVMLPAKEDPDSFIRHHGANEFHQLCFGARSLIDCLATMLIPHDSFATPERQADVLAAIDDTLKPMQNRELRAAYRRHVRDVFFSRRFGKRAAALPITRPPMKSRQQQLQQTEAAIMSLLLAHPHLIEQWHEALLNYEDQNPSLASLKNHILTSPHEHRRSAAQLKQYLTEQHHMTQQIATLPAVHDDNPDNRMKLLMTHLESAAINRQKNETLADERRFVAFKNQEITHLHQKRQLLEQNSEKKA